MVQATRQNLVCTQAAHRMKNEQVHAQLYAYFHITCTKNIIIVVIIGKYQKLQFTTQARVSLATFFTKFITEVMYVFINKQLIGLRIASALFIGGATKRLKIPSHFKCLRR
jgi:hypothetical protein